MISPGVNRCAVLIFLALICPAVWGKASNDPPIQIAFEVSPTPLGPYLAAGMDAPWQPFAIRRPGYAAAIPLVGSTEFLPFPGRGSMYGLLGNGDSEGYAEQHANLSEPQKAFLYATRALFQNARSTLVLDRPDPNGPQRLLLYALTVEDARKMAQAYFEYAQVRFQEQIEGGERAIREAPGQIAQEEKRVSKVDDVIAATQKALESLEKTVPYRTEEEAHQAVAELDRMLNAAQVEIAGIKAKLVAVIAQQGESRSRQRSQAVNDKLDMMCIEESIALQGAEARKQMATSLREGAGRLLDLKSTLARADAEKKTLAASLDKRQKRLAADKRYFASARENQPKVPDKVIIYRVKWVDGPTGN